MAAAAYDKMKGMEEEKIDECIVADVLENYKNFDMEVIIKQCHNKLNHPSIGKLSTLLRRSRFEPKNINKTIQQYTRTICEICKHRFRNCCVECETKLVENVNLINMYDVSHDVCRGVENIRKEVQDVRVNDTVVYVKYLYRKIEVLKELESLCYQVADAEEAPNLSDNLSILGTFTSVKAHIHEFESCINIVSECNFSSKLKISVEIKRPKFICINKLCQKSFGIVDKISHMLSDNCSPIGSLEVKYLRNTYGTPSKITVLIRGVDDSSVLDKIRRKVPVYFRVIQQDVKFKNNTYPLFIDTQPILGDVYVVQYSNNLTWSNSITFYQYRNMVKREKIVKDFQQHCNSYINPYVISSTINCVN